MIDVDVMQDHIRDVNPVPSLDDIDRDELARFVASARVARIPLTDRGQLTNTTDLLEMPGSGGPSDRLSRLAGRRPGPAVAAGIAVALLLIVGVATLLLRAVDRDTTPPATTPPPVTTTVPTQSTTERVLAPQGYRLQISTAVGDLEFAKLGSLGRPVEWIYIPKATPFGIVGLEGDKLWWSTDYLRWENAPIQYRAARVSVIGNDVIIHGDEVTGRFVWNGEGWSAAGQLDIDWVQLIASGPQGTVVASHDKVFHSSDGQHYEEAGLPPSAELLALAGESKERSGAMAGGCSEGIYNLDFSDSEIGALLATADGFVALTAAHPMDWGEPKICEPVPWFSSDGDSWQLVVEESPFGEDAAILPKVTERNGRFVAVGSTGTESAAVWGSDDGLSWDQIDLDVAVIDAVAAGGAGWMITGVTSLYDGDDEETHQVMFFSADGIAWDGPFDRPEGLTSGYLPSQLVVGPDAFFAIGGTGFDPVLGRVLED